MRIRVEAGEGAFPKGTTITAWDVEDYETIDTISEAVEGTVTKIHAVDITFFDKDYNEIEPLIPIRVVMTELEGASQTGTASAKAADAKTSLPGEAQDSLESLIEDEDLSGDAPVVVHLQDDGKTQLVETSAHNAGANAPLEVVFEAGSFSIYAVLETQISTHVVSADGGDFLITVTFGPEAGIPDGAVLEAEEIPYATGAYDLYTQQAAAGLNSTQAEDDAEYDVVNARYFDVRIMWNGQAVEPLAPVEVNVTYEQPFVVGKPEDLKVVHFAQSGLEIIDPLNTQTEVTQVTYMQGSFSVIGTSICVRKSVK